MEKYIGHIVFDIDGTLINADDDSPRYDVIDLLRWFVNIGWRVYIHSGGGIDYASRWCKKLGLEASVVEKGDPNLEYDIAVDDSLEEEDWTKERHGRYVKAKTYIIV